MDTSMDLGTYLDAQQRLLSAGYVLTYRRTLSGGRTYSVIASTTAGVVASSTRGPTLSHATVRLADRLAKGAR